MSFNVNQMFDLQSLCTNQVQPHWISTANTYQLEQTAKSIHHLWSKRNIIAYPQSNVSVDSKESLHCDLNINTYINPLSTESIISCNDLLPTLRKCGEISHLSSHNLSTFAPKHMFNIESIQIHIQFTDRSYDLIQNTLKKSQNHRKYLEIKRKKRRFRELSINNSNIRQSQRIRNKLQREICDFDNIDNNSDNNNDNNNNNTNNNKTILNLPDLEPTIKIKPKPKKCDSVSSMSITPEISNKNKRKASERIPDTIQPPLKKMKFEDEISNSFIYEITLDDLKFDFFLSLFPQLYLTHHLIYCMNNNNHFYYQDYFSSDENKYEWIQTDKQLMDIYHRYINKIQCKNRKIVFFFQMRPRIDTKSNQQQIEHHQQLLFNNLTQINQQYKNNNANNNSKWETDETDETDESDDYEFYDKLYDNNENNKYRSIVMNTNNDMLISNVIQAIHEQNNNINDINNINNENTENTNLLIAGTWDSGLCGFCEKRFSTNKCSQEEWIECEFCGKWYHVICTGLTNNDFLQFKNNKENKYKCLICSST